MLTLYVNGDSHSKHCYPLHLKLPTATQILADRLGLDYQNQAQGGGSNQRIIRTTLESLPALDPAKTIIIIGWSSFERTEWYYQSQWHQICGKPVSVDNELTELWDQHNRTWHANSDKEQFRRMQEQHNAIWCFHNILNNLGYKHLFYQGCNTFFFDGCPEQDAQFKLPWAADTWVHSPYVIVKEQDRWGENFSNYVISKGCSPSDDLAHFGSDAQQLWADYLESFLQSKINQLP